MLSHPRLLSYRSSVLPDFFCIEHKAALRVVSSHVAPEMSLLMLLPLGNSFHRKASVQMLEDFPELSNAAQL